MSTLKIQPEKLRDFLDEIAAQVNEFSPSLPMVWLQEMRLQLQEIFIEEPTPKWSPKDGENVFILHGDGEIKKTSYDFISKRYVEMGTVFSTLVEAEKCRDDLKDFLKNRKV